MLFTLRVSLPDRPGTLGELAGALGKGGANILTLDVVERSEGSAVDALTVEAPGGMREALQYALETVPGLVVEDVRPAGMFEDLLEPIELAALLARTPPAEILSVLVHNLAGALSANWCAAVGGTRASPELLDKSPGSPSFDDIRTPWMPLSEAKILPEPTWASSRLRLGLPEAKQGRLALAAAPLLGLSSAVLVGRIEGPRFRSAELTHLQLLAEIASSVMSTTEGFALT